MAHPLLPYYKGKEIVSTTAILNLAKLAALEEFVSSICIRVVAYTTQITV
jgi:hypothetical protein